MSRPRFQWPAPCCGRVWRERKGRPSSTPEAAQAADPRQLCLGPASTPDERVKGCSAVIESGQVQGSLLAAAYAQRGFVFTLKRNLEQAQKDLDQAIKIAPDYAEAYVNRANFWTVSNQPERAIADAERALKLAPKAPLAYFVRAGGEAKLGQYDKAIADYTEVLRLNPECRRVRLWPARPRLLPQARLRSRHRRLQ